ncbi:DUF1684 domain-containing protein [Flavobacterium piscinae]|uniref:DUF1684 domain-containing protein n=1 Tax=Flavobacterium piscinae TaxID=2506424 RepID=UPI002AABE987|nr:DUF1684 domain-containing protein [Flavobacterium piscinae]
MVRFFSNQRKVFCKSNLQTDQKKKPFEMKTTTSRRPLYVKYGELHFEIDGINCQLNVYQNVEFSKNRVTKTVCFSLLPT